MNTDGKDPCEVAEMVFTPPLSGDFDEKLFSPEVGSLLSIKFSDKYGVTEWIGKFGTGSSSSARVEKVCEPDKFLVSAGGFGYVIDATERQIVDQYHGRLVQDIAYDWQHKRFIVADYTKLHFVEGGKVVWSSKRITVDGIRDLKMSGRLITGLGYFDYEGPETKFTFDLDTRQTKRS